jgi:uncharacterized membrane protein
VITHRFLYVLMGILTGSVAIINLRDASNPRRYSNAAFWALWSVSFLAGSYLSDLANGVLVLALVALATTRGITPSVGESTTPEQRLASAARWRNRLFIPALAIPLITVAANATIGRLQINGAPLVAPKQVTLIALGMATIIALLTSIVMFRSKVTTPFVEARRLLDSVGWAAVLPQLLAALGAVFAAAGVGTAVSTLATAWIPSGNLLLAVVAYTAGMALLTMLMGNAFAAFPVMALGIGVPLLITQFHGNATVISAIGMLSGFCGTLMTPMAANYNLVPVALLDLPDRYAVIRVQIPTALLLLTVNTVLIYTLAF